MELTEWKKAKKQKGMTIADIAEKANLPKGTVQNIFAGYVPSPRIDTVQAIERALGIGRSEWTEEEKALGIVESVKVSVNEREMRWIQILSELDQVKGKEFTDKIVEMLETIAKK